MRNLRRHSRLASAIIILVFLVQLPVVTSWRQRRWGMWPLNRRGGATIASNGAASQSEMLAQSSSYTTVAVLVINSDDEDGEIDTKRNDSVQPGVMLIDQTTTTKTSNDEDNHVSIAVQKGAWGRNSGILWETVGLTSDIIVIVQNMQRGESTSNVPSEWLQRLGQGLRQRRKAGMVKSSLSSPQLLIVNDDSLGDGSKDAMEADQFREYLSVASAARLHWTTRKSLEAKLKDMIRTAASSSSTIEDKSSTSQSGLPSKAHEKLFQQVYNSLRRKEGDKHDAPPLLEPLIDNTSNENESVMEPSVESPKEAPTTLTEAQKRKNAVATDTAELDALYLQLQQAILTAIASDLDDLEQGIEQAMLENGVLDFAGIGNPALEDLRDGLDGLPANIADPIRLQVGSRLQSLWEQHLQTLRDFYGSRYEYQLAEAMDEDADVNQSAVLKSAQTISQAFAEVAEKSLPSILMTNGIDMVPSPQKFPEAIAAAHQGLLQDMQEATQRHSEDLEEASSISAPDADESNVRPWYHHPLLARAVMLAVNYGQGWLAWQGLKRAALERERHMPKVPLF